MDKFITPPNHIRFNAKKLFYDVNATILDSALAYVEPGGGGPDPAHTHDQDHIFIVVDGCATIRVGNEYTIVQKDEALYIKGQVEHSVWNKTNELMKIIKINCVKNNKSVLFPLGR